MRILKAGGLYFALVFAAGFALGTIRVLWVVPALGARTAELMEMPFMLVVTVVVARWVVGRRSTSQGRRTGSPRSSPGIAPRRCWT